jgi:hypothetical protein
MCFSTRWVQLEPWRVFFGGVGGAGGDCSLNSGLQAHKAGVLLLEPHFQSILL